MFVVGVRGCAKAYSKRVELPCISFIYECLEFKSHKQIID
jgi:hypothetical protein